ERRHLLYLAAQTLYRPLDLLLIPHGAFFRLFARRARQIARHRRVTETDDRFVLFFRPREELRQSRRAPDEQHEHARSERIERPRVSDPSLAEHAARARNDVVRGPAGRLVDDEDPIHRVSLAPSRFNALTVQRSKRLSPHENSRLISEARPSDRCSAKTGSARGRAMILPPFASTPIIRQGAFRNRTHMND